MSDTATLERIVRKPEAIKRLGAKKSKFEQDLVPRLVKVRLGPRCIGYTESSISKLIESMIAETATMAPIPTFNRAAHTAKHAKPAPQRRRRV